MEINSRYTLNGIVALVLLSAILLSFAFINETDLEGPVALAIESSSDAEATAVGDSATVYATVLPANADQSCTWTLSINRDEMTNWLGNRVSDGLEDGKVYLSLTVGNGGSSCTVRAVQYFKYGIKYKTYWILTATSVSNPQLSQKCYITLG